MKPTVRTFRSAVIGLTVLALAVTAHAQVKDWPSERPPRPLAARDIKFPPYEIQTLANGLQVVAVAHHEQPAISLRLIVRAGTASDPKDKLGLARLVGALLNQGTATRTAKQLNDDIDFIGGTVNTGAGADLSFISLKVMRDSFDHGLELVADMAERPAFAPEDVERQRQQIVSSLQVNMQDPDYLANTVFDRMVYGANAYGMPDNGTPATVAAITRGDLAAFHQKYFAPNNAILAIVGDVEPAQAFDAAKRVFGDWARRDVPKDKGAEPPSSSRRVIVIDKPDAVQTEIRVGHVAIARNHPDYMALNVAIRILGGEGSNRLHQKLRTERSLTYGAEAKLDTLKDFGDIEAETNTRSEVTGEALRLIVDEFWRLQRERVGEAELANAKAYMVGSFPTSLETPDQIAVQVLNAVFFGLPLEELQTYRERVNRVSADDIERVARFYLKPDAVSVVLVGNASAFTPQLRGVGFGRYEVVPLQNLDVLAADFKKAAGRAADIGGPRLVLARFQQQPAIAPQEGADARALLAKVIAAKGGLAALRAVRTVKAVMDNRVQAAPGAADLTATVTTYLQYPNHVRVEASLGPGVQLQVYDGVHGWVLDPAGVHDVPDDGLREMEAGLKRDLIAALVAADAGQLRVRLLPDVKDAEGKLQHALELSQPTLNPFVIYVDPQTNLISKEVFVTNVQGLPIVEDSFTDYRAVNGVMVPYQDTVTTNGRQVLTRRITDIQFNVPIDPALFTRPRS